ncbi:MAG: EAL domain-containing protein [Alphaproteobacteria bacterium]|nr:EAL domain-containing protein [Alphaproteobacteria bacterium]
MARSLRPRVFSAWEAIGFSLTLAAASAALVSTAISVDLENAEKAFQARAEIVRNELSQRISSTEAILTATAGLHHASDDVLPHEFTVFASQLLKSYPFIGSVLHMAKVGEEERHDFEAGMRVEGYPTFQITDLNEHGDLSRAEQRSIHFPLVTIEPLEPQSARLLGFDIFSQHAVAAAIERAIDSGQAATSKPFELFPGSTGFLALQAVYRGRLVPESVSERRSQVSGMIALYLDITQLFDSVLRDSPDLTLSVYLGTSSLLAAPIYSRSSEQRSQFADGLVPTFVQEKYINLHGKVLTVRMTTQPGLAAIRIWLVGLVALLAAVAGGSLVLVLRNRRITEIERKQTDAMIERMALEDPLTGLPNRAQFQKKLSEAIAGSNRTGRLTGLMLLDLDQFKHVNDTLGHPAGDTLLKRVATRISGILRETDTIARLGGDEFAVIATNVKTPAGVVELGQRILGSFEEPFVVDGKQIHSNTSIGATIYPHDWGNPDQLFRSADLALYHAKEEGSGLFRLFDRRIHAEIQARNQLEQDLRQALENDEFHVVYQAQIAIDSGSIVGAEALLRWSHPERGAVSPSEFIPIAESTGLIIPISEWLLRTVSLQVDRWRAKGFPPLRVSINVSPAHFRQDNLVEELVRILTESGLDTSWLELEITEGIAMEAREEIEDIFQRLKSLGIKLAIDDFGTGYSSLNRLKKFPIDRLKIDQSFVRDITTDWNDAAISAAVIRLGHSLNIEVIAEGVETVEQLEFLAAQGCDQVQGYLFSRPLTAQDFEAFVGAYDSETVERFRAEAQRRATDAQQAAGTEEKPTPYLRAVGDRDTEALG